MKDNFSVQASSYALFRPVYPRGLYEHLLSLTSERDIAWDCGCGNGQVAGVLSNYFDSVIATDISSNQIHYAVQKPNITYRVLPAERTDIAESSVGLITVAQAIHWFNIDEFYEEVKRVGKQGAALAIWCYNLPEINPIIDIVIQSLYSDVLGDQYWDPERKLVEERYQTIPFPFEELSFPDLYIQTEWHLGQLNGYLNSWSAVQHYIRKNGINPVEELQQQLKKAWGTKKTHKVSFPVYTRAGKVNT